MPIRFILGSIGLFMFGSIGVEVLRAFGVLDYPFFSLGNASRTTYIYATIASITYALSLFFLCRTLKIRMSANSGKFKPVRMGQKLRFLGIALSLAIIIVMLLVYSNLMSAAFVERHSSFHMLDRLVLLASIFCFFALADLREPSRIFFYIALIFAVTIPFSAGASRSVALPFIVAALTYFGTGAKLRGGIFMIFGLSALMTALIARGQPSYGAFWSMFFGGLFSGEFLEYLVTMLQSSMPGLQTMEVALGPQGNLSVSSFFRYIIYLSPLPSSVLPEDLFINLTLSTELGIDPMVLGINYDIYSEGLFWFGPIGIVIHTFFLAFFTVLPFLGLKLTFSKVPPLALTIAYFPVIYLILGGMVFSLRAGSRIVILFLVCLLLLSFLRRVKLKS